ncbi:hypothetical protein GQ457_12G014500 [Hibiscus cannabinus]
MADDGYENSRFRGEGGDEGWSTGLRMKPKDGSAGEWGPKGLLELYKEQDGVEWLVAIHAVILLSLGIRMHESNWHC